MHRKAILERVVRVGPRRDDGTPRRLCAAWPARPPEPRPIRKGAERFNEERATYTVRGSAQPDLAAGVAAIREVARTLKPKPGVYRMLDARGDVLYVGKARSLKNRVANYCQVADAAGAAAADGQPDPRDGDRHHQLARPRRCCSKRS